MKNIKTTHSTLSELVRETRNGGKTREFKVWAVRRITEIPGQFRAEHVDGKAKEKPTAMASIDNYCLLRTHTLANGPHAHTAT